MLCAELVSRPLMVRKFHNLFVRKFYWALLFATLVPYGCVDGPTAVGPTPSSPFELADASLFDDGIDFMADPAGLSGSWLSTFESDLSGRVARADVIAEIRVEALGTERDPEGKMTHVLAGESVPSGDPIKGRLADVVTLTSSPGSPGFFTIERAKSRLLKERFFVFVKWQEKDEGVVVARFHLSPASEALRKRLVRQVHGERRIVRRIR